MKSFYIILMGSAFTFAQVGGGLKVGGALQSELTGIQSFGGNLPDQFDYAGKETFTLNFKNTNSTVVKIEGSADFNLLYGLYNNLIQDQNTPGSISSGTKTTLLFDLRKLYAAFFFPKADIFVGRQIVNYGKGLVFSPIDVFSSVNIYDRSLRRRGSDVIRLRMPIGALSGFEITAGLEGVNHNATGAAKVYGTIRGIDLSTILIYKYNEHAIIGGLTFKTDLIAGIYGEIVEKIDTDAHHQNISVMIGADYSLSNMWFFNTEYLYSEHNNPVQNSQMSWKHSIFISARYAFNELSSGSLSAIADPQYGRGFLTTQYNYDILQNATLALFIRYLYTNHAAVFDKLPDMHYGISLEAVF